MNGRERCIDALEFRRPDRIPLFLFMKPWAADMIGADHMTPLFWKPEKPYKSRNLLTYIFNWLKKNPFFTKDEFGCVWYNPGNQTIGNVVEPYVLSTWDDMKDFKIPPKVDRGRWWVARVLIGMFKKSKYCVSAIGNFFFERMHFLRGFPNLIKDIKWNREKLRILGEKLADWYIWLVDRYACMGSDGIICTDDWGTNHGPFISPKDFNEVFKPLYKAVTDRVHAHGMHFILHSCGNIYYLIPHLIDAGVDCLQLDQPRQTGLKKLQEFCGKIAYMPVADISQVMPYKSVPEIEAEVLNMIKVLGSKGGLLGTIYSDVRALGVPQKKMDVVEKAYRRWGNYDDYPFI